MLTTAAFLGNVVGHEIGRRIGPPLYERDGRLLKRKHLDKTSEFFEKHGNKALVIGRFVPFVRTYITVIAGVTMMQRRRFFVWSAIGAVLWVVSIVLLGFFLGETFPALGENIDYAVLAILAFSVIPVAYEWLKHRRHNRQRAAAAAAASKDGSPADQSDRACRRRAAGAASRSALVSTGRTSSPTSTSGLTRPGCGRSRRRRPRPPRRTSRRALVASRTAPPVVMTSSTSVTVRPDTSGPSASLQVP